MKEKRVEITKKIKLFWNRHRVVIFHLKYNKILGQGQFWCLPYPVLWTHKILNWRLFVFKQTRNTNLLYIHVTRTYDVHGKNIVQRSALSNSGSVIFKENVCTFVRKLPQSNKIGLTWNNNTLHLKNPSFSRTTASQLMLINRLSI